MIESPIRPAMRSPLQQAMDRIGSAWTPATLFANNEQGVWYDPSDFRTMFQDSAGTTPVTAVGQPVGLMLDKSGRGNHATQATAAARPVLQQDANGKYYLAFDGVDDSLATAAINFTATDKMTVVAGVRKNSGGVQLIAELGTNGTDLGRFYFASGDSAPREWSFYAGGSTTANAAHSAYDTTPAPDTAVISGTQDIAGDLGRLRRNGIYGVDSTLDKGTGSFANHPLYIGSRAGTANHFNGRIYSLIVRGALSDAAQIAAAEAYVNGKTQAY